MDREKYKKLKNSIISKKPLNDIQYAYYMGYIDSMYDYDILESKHAQSLLDLIVKIRRR
mgnify:CR=1 FL=1